MLNTFQFLVILSNSFVTPGTHLLPDAIKETIKTLKKRKKGTLPDQIFGVLSSRGFSKDNYQIELQKLLDNDSIIKVRSCKLWYPNSLRFVLQKKNGGLVLSGELSEPSGDNELGSVAGSADNPVENSDFNLTDTNENSSSDNISFPNPDESISVSGDLIYWNIVSDCDKDLFVYGI